MTTLATPANMRAFEQANPARDIQTPEGPAHIEGRRCFAWSPITDEEASGDYWDRPDDAPLTDAEGEAMLLVTSRTVYFDALTGEPL